MIAVPCGWTDTTLFNFKIILPIASIAQGKLNGLVQSPKQVNYLKKGGSEKKDDTTLSTGINKIILECRRV